MSMYLDPIRHPNAWNRVLFKGVATPGKAVVSGWSRKNEYDVKVGRGTAGATETLKGQPPATGTITFYAWTTHQFPEWDPILDILRFDPSKGGNSATAATPTTTGNNFALGSASNPGGAAPSPTTGGGQTGTVPSPGAAGGPTTPKSSDGWPTNTSTAQPSLSAAYAIDIFHPALADIGVHLVLPPEELGIWEPDGDDGMYKREIKFLEFAQAKGNVATTPTGGGAVGDNFTTGGDPGSGGAAPAASGSAKGAGKDAQGAWGAK